ncbi:flagellin [Sulfuritalea sp.]|uniref:flagellin N-terminal helical domain-containing protein n=1 Tax=Sulfuritalea sp. TaxID=2480090 RepID=UPI00286E997F|nr:flagellin [Sulfuritalea sp.]
MAQVINTNVSALFAGAALNKSANALQTAQSRLASGLRINSAKDDASGLAAATSYDTQIRTTNVQIRNASDAISTAQTYDGYLGQITENLQRMSEILAGVPAGNAETTALAAENTRINALVLAGAPTIGTTIATVAADLTAVGTARAAFGATMAAKSSEVATLQIAAVNLSAAYSRIMDTDYAAETTAMTRNNILQQAGTAVLAQANQTPNTVLSLLR